MIDPGKFHRIVRLLKEGRFSNRKIARITGVSRGTANLIANGKHCLFRKESRAGGDLFLNAFSEGPLGRCPTCGAKIYGECRTCQTRSMTRTEMDSQPAAEETSATPFLGVHLKPRHQIGYEEIRRRRGLPDLPSAPDRVEIPRKPSHGDLLTKLLRITEAWVERIFLKRPARNRGADDA